MMTNSNKKRSNTAIVFLVGSILVLIKYFISGIEIGDIIKFSNMSGIDFAAAITALGGVYTLRRSRWVRPDNKLSKNTTNEYQKD